MENQNNNAIVCKHCQSTNTRKYGFVEGTQKYYCNDCRRKFGADDRLFKMKTSYYQVSSAIDDYYKGDSINEIRDNLHTRFQTPPPSSKAVYGWITKYTDKAVNQFKDYHPQVGKVFVADETVLRIAGKKYWCIAIIDKDTRFLLATKLSSNRDRNDIKALMERARDCAGKIPDKVLTDGWGGYRDGIELAYGAESKHIVTEPFGDEYGNNTELIERWNGTLKDRTKSLRGLKSVESAKKFLDGFLAWYNYMRPHESLNGKTPAEQAKIQYDVKSWSDVVRTAKPHIQVLTTPAKVDILSERKPLVRPITHRHYDLDKKNKQRTALRIRNTRISKRATRITPPMHKIEG
ncbi:MAG: DDE-type integrase/transposase/recombinase [Eubacteriales bacterium]